MAVERMCLNLVVALLLKGNSECLRRCGIIDGKGKVLIGKIDGGVLELDGKGCPTGFVDERVTGYLTRMGGIDADEIVDDKLAETYEVEPWQKDIGRQI